VAARDEHVKRLVAGLTGIGFTALGAVLVISFLYVLIAQNAPLAALGLLPALLGLGLGPVVLTRGAYDVTATPEGLHLSFVFRNESVPWTRVRAYRKIGVTWGAAVEPDGIRAAIFVILDYDRPEPTDTSRARAYTWLVGVGPAFSRSSADFRTCLDEHVPEKNRRLAPPAVSAMAATLLLSTSAALAAPAADVLDAALRAFVTGKDGVVASLFRYFEESVPTREAASDRQIMATFFGLVQHHFGRPAAFDQAQSTSSRFANVFMESATPDLWRNSDCVFRTYAYRTTFQKGPTQRHAEVLIEACLDRQLRPKWLKKVDIHFPNPDDATVRAARQLFKELDQKIRGTSRGA
jgi:hypothetical protein